ncbi:concanavalin A-like lectin/glucanase domain-containing protein [Mycena albidolilacea]|uniref:Concanavalin A-like lectin/glucanase domain-containing protein n=1 Tax=Mycena albidolilacea TaxID=1033008 RepID=A0AAD7E8G3_9AGAR|nr:concanavalin A-like lectin/glucanase domain-containing protein [Mycena albidolilacea]
MNGRDPFRPKYHASFILLKTLVLSTVCATQVLAQSCPCGYKDSSGHVWREAIVSTFTQTSGALAAVAADWVVATDLEVQGGTATANIQYVTANVYQHNDALGLKASAYTSGVFQRSDILYGSFRMQAQVPSVSGVVFGFFTYITDQQEQDIEFLSSDSDYYQHVYYTNQPGQLPNGNVNTAAAKNVVIPNADFTRFGIHRFDWLPTTTTYSYAGTSNSGATVTSSTVISTQVPNTPSEFILNVWSNGDPNFSKGPPTADAIATVQYVHLYFNSTTFSATSFINQCNAHGNVAPCNV